MNFQYNCTNTSTETIHVFEKNRNLHKEVITEEAIDWIQIDWNNLGSVDTPSSNNKTEIISYDEALEYFKGADLSEYNEKISSDIKNRGNQIFVCFKIFTKRRLKDEHINDYRLLFLIAKCPYEKNNKTHIAMLKTVYDSVLINKDLNFSWENIGFQSNSPWTDLRGVGMFGVLQLLYFSEAHPLIKNIIYELSLNKNNAFPFAVVGLNITSIVLNVLRCGKLNCDVSKEGVFAFVNSLYAGIFHQFRETWSSERKTISDIGKLLKDLKRLCFSKRARDKMMRNLKSLDNG